VRFGVSTYKADRGGKEKGGRAAIEGSCETRGIRNPKKATKERTFSEDVKIENLLIDDKRGLDVHTAEILMERREDGSPVVRGIRIE
jgi:hypothetical protein